MSKTDGWTAFQRDGSVSQPSLPHHLLLVSVGTLLILCRKGPALKQGDPHTELSPVLSTEWGAAAFPEL